MNKYIVIKNEDIGLISLDNTRKF